jgi:hypothetical protein
MRELGIAVVIVVMTLLILAILRIITITQFGLAAAILYLIDRTTGVIIDEYERKK